MDLTFAGVLDFHCMCRLPYAAHKQTMPAFYSNQAHDCLNWSAVWYDLVDDSVAKLNW